MIIRVEQYREFGEKDIRRLLPVRKRDTHKGNYGRILLLCGSVGFTGAARLAAAAALRTGAGLVFLGVPERAYPVIAASAPPEAIVFPLPDDGSGHFSEKATPEIIEKMARADAILLGSGCGNPEGLRPLIRAILAEQKVPVILDADGINALSGHMDILQGRQAPVILTPHDGEFARIYTGAPCGRYSETVALAAETGCILLRKGMKTLISDGVTTYRNRTGNPGMATGGSGDVLSGILASLVGQKVPPLEAAALGAYIHGAAGDRCASRLGEYGMLPSDLIAEIPAILG